MVAKTSSVETGAAYVRAPPTRAGQRSTERDVHAALEIGELAARERGVVDDAGIGRGAVVAQEDDQRALAHAGAVDRGQHPPTARRRAPRPGRSRRVDPGR